MIIELKAELERVATEIGATFTSKSNSELQDFAQGFDFASPLINLKPIETYGQDIIASGAIRYDFRFELFFLTNFAKSDHLEDTKDVLIDDMTQLSELFFTTLNKNQNQYFINPSWKWTNGILRQYLSNLTCGIQASIFIDTSCNRVEDGFIPTIPPIDPPETFDELVALIGRGYAYPQPTGQTTVFRTSDDADIEATIFAPIRAANSLKAINSLAPGSFTILNNNSEFGNTDRHTDTEGLQDYGATGGALLDYIVDNLTGLAISVDNASEAWNDNIDNAAASTKNGFTDWFSPNDNQFKSIADRENSSWHFDYTPFNDRPLFFAGANYWTSTTRPNATTIAFGFQTTFNIAGFSKTGSLSRWIMRKHF